MNLLRDNLMVSREIQQTACVFFRFYKKGYDIKYKLPFCATNSWNFSGK